MFIPLKEINLMIIILNNLKNKYKGIMMSHNSSQNNFHVIKN